VLEVLGDGGSGEGPSFKKGLPPKKHFHRNCIEESAILDAIHYRMLLPQRFYHQRGAYSMARPFPPYQYEVEEKPGG
jgi:hypothetical protein